MYEFSHRLVPDRKWGSGGALLRRRRIRIGLTSPYAMDARLLTCNFSDERFRYMITRIADINANDVATTVIR
jgi:hypothetical protein